MNKLLSDGLEVEIRSELLDLISHLSAALSSPQAALDALRRACHGDSMSPIVAEVLDRLQISSTKLCQLYLAHEEVLGWLTSTVGELERKEHSWPLEAKKKAKLGAGELALSADGRMEAYVESDIDGEALDGVITFDVEREAIFRIGVSGRVGSGAKAKASAGAASASLAFEAGGNVALDNYYRHNKSDGALGALVADIAHFTLPARIGPRTLRARTVTSSDTKLVIPDQWIHLNASGYVAVSGGLSWGGSMIRTYSARNDGLGLDEQIEVSAGASAEISYSRRMSGNFDIVLSAAHSDESWIAVELAKSKASQRQVGFKVGAELGISGLDRVAKGALDGLLSGVNELVDSIESQADELGDLKGLFGARLDKNLDTLLKRSSVVKQIQSWLTRISDDVDVKETLKKVAKDAAIKVTESHIDELQDHVDEVTKVVKDIIRAYRGALAKVEAVIQRAADLKVGVSFARTETRLELEETTLSFEVDVRSEKGQKLLGKMVRGDFEEAMTLARNNDPVVDLRGGALVEKGSLNRATEINFNVFGHSFGRDTILNTEWEASVTTNGDVTIGVTTTLEARHRSWSELRTCTLLADSALVGVVGEANALADVSTRRKLTVELTRDWRPDIKSLEAFAHDVSSLQVDVPDPVTLVKDLASTTSDDNKVTSTTSGGSKIFGELKTSILMELGKRELDQLVSAAPETARRVFANALLRYYISSPRFHVCDNSPLRLPVMLWDSVQAEEDLLANWQKTTTTSSLQFRDASGEISVTYQRTDLILLYKYCRLINSFSAMLEGLASTRGRFKGMSRKDALDAIRNAHLDIMDAAENLVTGTLKGGYLVNYALFSAIRELASVDRSLAPFLTVRRLKAGDERVFVYG